MLLVKYKDQPDIKTPICTIPVEAYGTTKVEKFSFPIFDKGYWELWVDPILPYFNAYREGEWIHTNSLKGNVFHALVVLTRSVSKYEVYVPEQFKSPPPDKDPLQHLFSLYDEDEQRIYGRKLFSNPNHGFQWTNMKRKQLDIPLEKLSLTKLVEDLNKTDRKVDACWRTDDRVGVIS